MLEMLIGAVVAVALSMWANTPDTLLPGIPAASLVLYMLSCWVFPYRRCWRCGGDDRHDDGRGNYRHKRPCWWCGGAKDNRRIGARLIGRG